MTKIKLPGGLELDLTEKQKKELIAQLGVKENKGWKPNIDERYWCIGGEGYPLDYQWNDDEYDNFELSIGNVFQTEKLAEEALKTGWVAKLQARKRLDDYIAEKGFDIDVDWGNDDQVKYSVACKALSKSLIKSTTFLLKDTDLPHFKNESDRNDTMQAMEEEYKILLGVK